MKTDIESAGLVKVLFNLENKEVESVWARPVENGYQIDNIPFYAMEIACNDVVSVKSDKNGMLHYAGLVAASGHSTIRLWFANETDVGRIRNELRAMNCSSEMDLPRLVAVDIPPAVPYGNVRRYLDEQEAAGTFEYEEACLGQH